MDGSYDVTSPGNDRVKRLIKLRNRRHRDAEQLFVVEEERIFDRAIAAGHVPTEVYWCPNLCEAPSGYDGSIVTLSVAASNRASYRSSSTGLIALFPHFDTSLSRLGIASRPLVLVAEGLEKPGNLGAFLRIADTSGAEALIVVASLVDPFNPNVVRTSTGALFTVALAVSDDVDEVGRWLEERGIRSVAATPESDQIMWNADLGGALAIWIGSEADGLSTAALRIAADHVSIPLKGAVDSLNAASAAALLAYESVRQRRT